MKPSTLIAMAVGLFITVGGFFTCVFAMNSAEKNYPNDSIFAFENENFEKIDADSVRTVDFSDVITIYTEESSKEVTQDVKALSVSLSDIKHVEIIGGQSTSKVMMYNFRPGMHACEISAGVITVTNVFKDAMIFDYLSDLVADFHGLRKYIGQNNVSLGAEKKVIIYINDDDILNRINLDLVNCENVTVKNLTCSLDCEVVLNNSDIIFENCTFKDPEIIYPDNYDPDAEPSSSSSTVSEENDKEEPAKPTVVNHYLTIDLTMRNGSTFKSKNCKFSSLTGMVNKKLITEKDIAEDGSIYTEEMLGTAISSGGALCTIDMDFTTVGLLYGYNIENIPDDDYSQTSEGITTVAGIVQPEKFIENTANEDYPQIEISASNCNITIYN